MGISCLTGISRTRSGEPETAGWRRAQKTALGSLFWQGGTALGFCRASHPVASPVRKTGHLQREPRIANRPESGIRIISRPTKRYFRFAPSGCSLAWGAGEEITTTSEDFLATQSLAFPLLFRVYFPYSGCPAGRVNGRTDATRRISPPLWLESG
jgi:hypothetical protein